MTQTELNRAVAHTTGETVSAIAEMGFVPLTPIPIEREPTFVDWDELDLRQRGIGQAKKFSSSGWPVSRHNLG